MSLVSVVTAVYQPEPEYPLAAYESLDGQRLPAGWEWEWLVQEDGRTGAAATILPADERIKFGHGRHNGVAITRDLALAVSDGSLVKNLDPARSQAGSGTPSRWSGTPG